MAQDSSYGGKLTFIIDEKRTWIMSDLRITVPEKTNDQQALNKGEIPSSHIMQISGHNPIKMCKVL